jgi:hypothetical protein
LVVQTVNWGPDHLYQKTVKRKHGWEPPLRSICPKLVWDRVPEHLKSHVVLDVGLDDFQICQENGINFDYQLSGPQSRPEAGDFLSSELLEEWFVKYQLLQSVTFSELDCLGFTSWKKKYLQTIIELAGKYDKQVYLISNNTECMFRDIGMDPHFCELMKRLPDVIVPVWEIVKPVNAVLGLCNCLGLWLSGSVNQWGVNPQTWWWEQTGLHLDRTGKSAFEDTSQKKFDYKSFRRTFVPTFGNMAFAGAAHGATVYYYGAEAAPHLWDFEGSLTHRWDEAIALLDAMVSTRLIPTREEIAEHAHIGYMDRGKGIISIEPCDDDPSIQSVRMISTCKTRFGISPEQDMGVIPVVECKTLHFTAETKIDESHTGRPLLLFRWLNSEGVEFWDEMSEPIDTTLSGNNWYQIQLTAKVPREATYVLPYLAVFPGKKPPCSYKGSVYFRKVNLVYADDPGKQILNNGDFLNTKYGDLKQPKDWIYFSWGFDHYDLFGSLNWYGDKWELLRQAWDMKHLAELLPNNTKNIVIPIFPSSNKLPDTCKKLFSSKEDLKDKCIKKTLKEYYKKNLGIGGYISRSGSLLYMANEQEVDGQIVKTSVYDAFGNLNEISFEGPPYSYAIGSIICDNCYKFLIGSPLGSFTRLSFQSLSKHDKIKVAVKPSAYFSVNVDNVNVCVDINHLSSIYQIEIKY